MTTEHKPHSKSEKALSLAREIRDAERELLDSGWGGYPWEHLGDASRDISVLISGLHELEEQVQTLLANEKDWSDQARDYCEQINGLKEQFEDAARWEEIAERRKRDFLAASERVSMRERELNKLEEQFDARLSVESADRWLAHRFHQVCDERDALLAALKGMLELDGYRPRDGSVNSEWEAQILDFARATIASKEVR